jgi:hypothetical protein
VTRTKNRFVKPLDPATRFVRSLDGEYYMLREAAAKLGVSDRTLRNLLQGKVGGDPNAFGPSYKVNFGKITIYLYTKEDIEKIRKHLEERRQVLPNEGGVRPPGRPVKWTDEQRRERQRLYSAQHYYRRRLAEADGDKEKETEIKTKLAEIEKGLKQDA